MPYSAQKNASGTYDVFQGGQKIATGSDAVLGNYGLTGQDLTGGTPQTATIAPTPPQSQESQASQQPQPSQTQGSPQETQSPQPQEQGNTISLPSNGSIVDLLNSTGQPSSYTSRAHLAQQLGIQNYSGTASQNQQLARKYVDFYNSKKGTPAPSQNPRQDIAQVTQPPQSVDPIFGGMAAMMAPIMQSLTGVINDINNPALTGQSLQQEYNDLSQKNNLPQLQTELLNMNNVMNGTEQDIRDELTKSGGFATDSQVMALTASRNKVIMKQYNALSTQYSAATQNVQNMMQFAAADQSTALQKKQMTASVTESIASIYQQMFGMGVTMQQNANANLNKIVTNVGYTGLAQQAQNDPQVLSYYERSLGLAPGALSDPASLKQMETYRQQQLKMSQQKIVLQYGYLPGTSGTTGPTPGASSSGLIPDPASSVSGSNGGDILTATGMTPQVFNYLTQGTASMSRMTAGQRNQIFAQTTKWLQDHNIDISTFQSQYKAVNTTLSNNIQRFNNTQIAEGEVTGTLSNIDSSAVSSGLGSVNVGNVGRILAGQQVNDPAANEYSFYFNDLKNSLAYFYAAQQGKSSPDVIDNQDAANVIVSGLSKGGVKGLQSAVSNTTNKMKTVLNTAVDNARKSVWDLFGVSDKYQSSTRPVKVLSPDGKSTGTIPASQLKDALAQGYSQI